MSKKWFLIIPASIILSGCSLANKSTAPSVLQPTPTQVVMESPTPTNSVTPKVINSSDVTNDQIDKDLSGIDKKLMDLKSGSTTVDTNLKDTPIDVNK